MFGKRLAIDEVVVVVMVVVVVVLRLILLRLFLLLLSLLVISHLVLLTAWLFPTYLFFGYVPWLYPLKFETRLLRMRFCRVSANIAVLKHEFAMILAVQWGGDYRRGIRCIIDTKSQRNIE